MSQSKSDLVPFRHGKTCPVCGGSDEDPRGNGTRCHGFIAGDWIHCAREDYANRCTWHESSQTFAHKLKGKCHCGVEHSPADPGSNGHANGNGRSSGKLGQIVAVYPYRDELNQTLYETVRFDPKDFRQRRPGQESNWSIKGVRLIPYNLPELMSAPKDQIVWIVEGEKDVESLTAAGCLATCNPMGAGKWKSSYSEFLRGRHCRIIPDNDEKGQKHARDVYEHLAGKVASVKIVTIPGLPPKGDVSDWFTAGHTVKELNSLSEINIEIVSDEPLVKKVGEHERWISCLKNTEIWFSKRQSSEIGSSIRYDNFRQTILIDNKIISDEILVSFKSYIEAETRTPWNLEFVREALILIASKNQFSSLVEYLESIQWDGEYRLNRFFTEAYGCVYTSYVGECARVLFLSAVARAFNPGCQSDVMVVLIGPQGVGKSMGIASLSPYPEWYADSLGSDLAEGKAGEGLQGKWLYEFSEFALINRATMDTVKSFISRRVDHYRPPYGRISRDFPRSCVFVGTTNDPHPLRDVENRRFMPITCIQGNIEWMKANRDQLWAESAYRFKQGEKWWVDDPETSHRCLEAQELARSDDAWETILEDRLTGLNKVTMEDAAKKLEIEINRLDKPTQTRIGIVLSSIGFTRKRSSQPNLTGKRSYYYERPTKDF